ncbi:MAG: phasin family protein [Rhodocyclales bacterium]|nr:phasin family protein [Rhodocyclales bacterium]
MVKKLKSLAAGATDSQLAATIKDSAQQIWLAGLGAFAKAQEEGNKVFEALVKEGEAIQSKTRKVAEDKVIEMAGKATGTWDKLEQVFEERVARAMGRLGVPSKKDVDTLTKRVADLTAVVEKLTATKPAAKAAAKPVAKPAAKKAPAKAKAA